LAQEPDIAHARILTFGYDASFRPGSSKNATTVLDFAKDLLFEMKYAKDELHHELGELNMGQVRNLKRLLGTHPLTQIVSYSLRCSFDGGTAREGGTQFQPSNVQRS
jgi:hypothetical protein